MQCAKTRSRSGAVKTAGMISGLVGFRSKRPGVTRRTGKLMSSRPSARLRSDVLAHVRPADRLLAIKASSRNIPIARPRHARSAVPHKFSYEMHFYIDYVTKL